MAIARSIVVGRPVLILDEPFAHLDEGAGFKILEAIRRRASTVVLVTHQKVYIEDFDRNILLEGGVVKEAAHNEGSKSPSW